MAIRFESLDGEALDGLLYPGVRRAGIRTKSAESIEVPSVPRGGYTVVALDAACLEAELCGYSTGYVPRRIALREQPGYPDHLQPIRIRFERGVEVRGRVVDASGRGVAAARVQICSLEPVTGGLVSMGSAHSRVTGGLWETTVTGDDGGYAFTGVAPGTEFRVYVVDREPRQTRADRDVIHRATSDPCVVDLTIR